MSGMSSGLSTNNPAIVSAFHSLLGHQALVAGVILALMTVRYAQPWVHWTAAFHGHDG